MGFSQVDHMLSWFGSKKVMPFVKDLWHDCVKDREKRRTGPKLSQIKKVIDDDEGTGEERFDIHTPEPRDSWAEIDHVAYFVTRLMQANMEGKIGIFWKKDFSKDERYDRILQVYLHWSNVRFPEKREAALNIEPPPDSFTLQAANNEEGTRESDTGMTLNARGGEILVLWLHGHESGSHSHHSHRNRKEKLPGLPDRGPRTMGVAQVGETTCIARLFGRH